MYLQIVSLVGTANESFSPTIMKVQEVILEDNASKPIPILAYSTELGFNVLLLCAMYRVSYCVIRFTQRQPVSNYGKLVGTDNSTSRYTLAGRYKRQCP
jgi:hypothetical protein